MGETIGVISLKGGVGKTSVVSSLGGAIADFGKKVLLIDGNLSAPNLGLHLNVIDPEVTLHHVLARESNIKDAIYEAGNLDMIPSSIFKRKNVNPMKLKERIRFLKKKYDVVLIDSSPVLNEETLAVMLASDGLFVVTTPDHPTLAMTLKAVKLAKQRGTPITGLIINKANNKNFELSLDDIEETAEVPVMAVIPHDINFLKALPKFVPLTTYKPNSDASTEYRKLAATLIGEKYKPFKIKDIFKFTPKRHEINREIYYENVFR